MTNTDQLARECAKQVTARQVFDEVWPIIAATFRPVFAERDQLRAEVQRLKGSLIYTNVRRLEKERDGFSDEVTNLANTVTQLRAALDQAEGALKPLARLADARDAELIAHGCAIPAAHDGDDSSVATPEDGLIPYLEKRSQPYYVTMRDACTARQALARIAETRSLKC